MACTTLQDAVEVALGGADPLRSEVLELDGGKPALFGKRFRDERLSGAHRPGEEHSHRATVSATFADVLGDVEQLSFDLVEASHHLEAMGGPHELDEAEALALDDLVLDARQVPHPFGVALRS